MPHIVNRAIRHAAIGALGLAAFGLAPAADAQPSSPPFVPSPWELNQSTPCDQRNPQVVRLATGELQAAWFDFLDGSASIAGRRLSEDALPVADERTLLTASEALIGEVELAALPDGGFLIAWGFRDGELFEDSHIALSRFDSDGELITTLTVGTSTDTSIHRLALAVDSFGRPALAWIDGDGVWLILYDADLAPVTGLRLVGEPEAATGALGQIDIARAALGHTLVVWDEGETAPEGSDRVRGRALDPDGNFLGGPFQINQNTIAPFRRIHLQPSIAAVALDRFVVVWTSPLPTADHPEGVYARELLPDGTPAGDNFRVHGKELFGALAPQVIPTADSGYAVVWSALPAYPPVDPLPPGLEDPVIRGRRFGLGGIPSGGDFELWDSPHGRLQSTPVVALSGERLVVVWRDHNVFPPILVPPCPESATILAMTTELLCVPTRERLCLQKGRFAVEAERPRVPAIAPPHYIPNPAVPLTDDTGTFWFFRPGNVELMVKVLDGRALNQRFWFFSGALSDVDYRIVVTDTVTDHREIYPSGRRLVSFGDTRSFFEPPAPPVSPAAAPPAGSGRAPEAVSAAAHPTEGCSSPQVLCFDDERFEARIEWSDPRTGTSGQGVGVHLTDESGYFWFFRDGNAELVFKLLDGRLVNGHFWTFIGGLSDLEYRLTVEDNLTHAVWTYEKPAGQLASDADVWALSDHPCPVCSASGGGAAGGAP